MKEIFRIIANTFRNGNHYDYVDWTNADTVVIDGTYDLEELASDIERHIISQRQSWLRSEIEKLGVEIRPTLSRGEEMSDDEVWNQALTSIITRYKEELLELDKEV